MRKRQSESNYRLQDGLFAGQAPVQVDSRHNLSATQLGSTPGPGLLTHSGLTSSWATEHLGNAMVAPFFPIYISFLPLLHLQSAAMVAMATMTAMALVPPLEVTWFCDIIVAARWTLATGLAGWTIHCWGGQH